MNELQYKSKEQFYSLHEKIGQFNLQEYYKYFSRDLSGKSILDIGCGEGNDLAQFKTLGANIHGIDINPVAIEIAQKRFNVDKSTIRCSNASDTGFMNESFDIVASNYVFQAIENIEEIYEEINRVLKKDGEFIFLATHPMRQYFEKKNIASDYFQREIVDSVILNGTITVQEPTHTMNEYLSEYFLSHFTVEKFIELEDPTAEKVEGRKYPGFFIIKARKK